MSPAMLSRRAFLGGTAAAGAFVLGTRLVPVSVFSQDALAQGPWEPGVYLAILPDGLVQIVAHRSEMGTGIRTSLPLVVADELDADWARVTIVQALGDKKYGSQNTDGSCSIKDFYEPMRVAGATARTMLEQAAAKTWNVPVGEVAARNHAVVHAQQRQVARLRRTRRDRPHAARTRRRVAAVQEGRGVPLHRQAHSLHRPRRHRQGAGHLRRRRRSSRHGVRLDFATAGAREFAGVGRRCGGAQGRRA